MNNTMYNFNKFETLCW